MFQRFVLTVIASLIGLSVTARAEDSPNILLILDASGSMNARLASGETRIEAAKAAIGEFTAGLPSDTRVSYRVYGHQSPREQHNCQDTELMVGFDSIVANRGDILTRTAGVKAQGYTPITYVIRLAAAEIAKEPGRRTIVLVSDGKETCEGDPCAAARALADADAGLVIHTIGFNVDTAARYQLQCMARVARGTYSDATGAADLGAKLGEVAVNPAPTTETTITITRPKPGKLQIRNPDTFGHKVTEAEGGRQVAELRGVVTAVELPAGLYNVTFGPTVWKSVEVKAGETTVLEPGVLELGAVGPLGHKVLDWETGVQVGMLSGVVRQVSVLPSTFNVTFGGVQWKHVEVKAGERKLLNPAVIAVKPPDSRGNKVYAEDGTLVATLLGVISEIPVPPGKYTVEVGDQKVPLDLVEGQRMVINLQ